MVCMSEGSVPSTSFPAVKLQNMLFILRSKGLNSDKSNPSRNDSLDPASSHQKDVDKVAAYHIHHSPSPNPRRAQTTF